MKPRNGAVIALLFFATCSEEVVQDPSTSSTREAVRLKLGKVPASEVATWTKVGASSIPEGRYLQAAAFDESRKVVVMFGGQIMNFMTGMSKVSQETWEWSPATGKWTDRTDAGNKPDARSGAAMAFDSKRNKMVLFGGRAGSGYNFEDTWEWDPATGVWTDLTNAGTHPGGRSQHGMVYEKSKERIFLFGGGRSDGNSYGGTGVSVSLSDAWELDPVAHTWTEATVSPKPTARHDFGMVWDSSRNKVVVFAGMQSDISGAAGVPKQDMWEWDPTAGTWAERTVVGNKPSQRYGHAMAFDGSRNIAVVFGGWDISTNGSLSDLWDWDPASGAWTERLTGMEDNLPSPRMYASLISDDGRARLELVGGAVDRMNGTGGMGGIFYPPGYGFTTGSNEVWELEPKAAAFTNRSAPPDTPLPRQDHAMAYCPANGKVYVFGGYDLMQQPLDDLWEWNGTTWTQIQASNGPSARIEAGLAYDPARKSLILFGGTPYFGQTPFGETWEFNISTGKWMVLKTDGTPDPLSGHGMVTDTVRNKILLFGGDAGSKFYPGSKPMKDPLRNEVWEWDGSNQRWSNRTPIVSSSAPYARTRPYLTYDEGRQKLFLYDGQSFTRDMSAFWEWDPISAGWSLHEPQDTLPFYQIYSIGYDSIRRRQVMASDNGKGYPDVAELDTNGPTWYARAMTSGPGARWGATMVFDVGRSQMVLFGGYVSTPMTNGLTDETWTLKITNWGNGEGCTAASASSCASGNCVDGVCCDVAACSGPCKSCNVAGSEGTCVAATAGTEVPGSCANNQACDGSGNCKTKNGQTCSSASTCASGNCVDGVCCDTGCTGTCQACNLPGQVGKCSPHPVGSDPDSECGVGSGTCRSTCDGASSCSFPQYGVPCDTCMMCNGSGTCSAYDPYCYNTGGSGGYTTSGGGAGGYITGRGGAGGYTTGRGGSGGWPGTGGYTTGRGGSGGTGGYTTGRGGSGGAMLGGTSGYTTVRGGSGGSFPGVGGSGGYSSARGGSGGSFPGAGGSAGRDGSASGGTAGSNRDGGDSDGIDNLKLHRSGCSCETGQPGRGADLYPALLLLGATVLAQRLRRRRKDR